MRGTTFWVVNGQAVAEVVSAWTGVPVGKMVTNEIRTLLGLRETLAKRVPSLVSFLFGLVHGLGFAGALKNIGLPQSHLPLALLCFNVGVELGQLLTVLAAYLVVRIPVSPRWLGSARRPALYAIGAIAAYWSFQRMAAILVS